MFRRPRLLVYTLYALFFVLVWNDATNSMQFALHVFISATWTGDACPESIDPRFLRFLAVVLVTFVCLLHYFSARIGRVTNMTLAVGKFIMVLALFGLGCRAVQQNPNHGANYDHIDTNITIISSCTNTTISHIPASGSKQVSNGAAAFLLVLFSFQGWENATFVSRP
jgi:amino acid transporter